MKRVIRFVFSCTTLVLALPAGAQETASPTIDDPKLAQAIREATDRAKPRWCAELAPLWAEAAERAKPASDAIALEAANAAISCAVEERRYEEAASLIVRTEARLGQQARFNNLALSLHTQLMELDPAVARVRNMAGQMDGQFLRKTDPGLLYRLNSQLIRARRSDLRTVMWSAIYASKAFDTLDPDLRGATAGILIRLKADAGTLTEADSGLVDLLMSPVSLATMLANRSYSALWPRLEERAGDGMASLLEADVQLKTARYREQPDNIEQLANLGYALLQAGRNGELITLTAPFREKNADYARLGSQGAWIINYMATALLAEGRTQEGLAALQKLASLDPTRYPWVVSFAINHALALGEDQQHANALKALDRAQTIADKYGSGYARALVAAQRACSLHALGRANEAAAQLALLEKLRPDAPVAAVEYAMCAGRDDLAAAWALQGLADDKVRQAIVDALQPVYMESKPTSVADPEPYRLLGKSPELAAAFDKVARVVPERHAPLGGRKRIMPSAGPAPR
jgi:tetratricopeptide (TPR) repeat protein